MDRVLIRGTSGSGKTTLGRALAKALETEAVDLDELYWLPGWEVRPIEEFRALVAEVAARPRWVAMGNYRKVRDLLLPRADTILWLDYPLPVTFGRVFRRTLRRCLLGERCCNGNREEFFKSFFSPRSVIWWSLTTHARQHRDCLDFMAEPTPEGQARFCHRSPRETREWLRTEGVRT